MTVIGIIKHGFLKAIGNWKLAILVYFVQLALVVSIGVHVFQIIDASMGSSLELEKIKSDFNYTVFHDMLNVNAASFSTLFVEIIWLLIVYLIISVFVNAGSICVLCKGGSIRSTFWKSGVKYFISFLALSFFYLIVSLLWTALVWIPYFTQLFVFIENWVAEYLIIWLLIGLTILYFLGLAFLFSCSLNARLATITEGDNFIKSIKRGFYISIKKRSQLIPILLIFALLITMIYIVNFLFEWNVGMKSTVLIIVSLVLQQFIVITKIITRLAIYASFILLKN